MQHRILNWCRRKFLRPYIQQLADLQTEIETFKQYEDVLIQGENTLVQQEVTIESIKKILEEHAYKIDCNQKAVEKMQGNNDYFSNTLAEHAYDISNMRERVASQELESKRLLIRYNNIMNQKELSMRVIQIVPVFRVGDAIGNCALVIDTFLKENQYDSEIYTYANEAAYAGVKIFSGIPVFHKNDILILHMAAENEFADLMEAYDSAKVLMYHNITPPAFFEAYDAWSASSTKKGLLQVEHLKDKVDFCITDSNFNKNELVSKGYKCPIDVIPVPIDFSKYEGESNPSLEKKLRKNSRNFLFVGRMVPNKKIEDVIRCFKAYVKNYDRNAHLILAGNYCETDQYYLFLQSIIQEEQIQNVVFTGRISQTDLNTYYKCADMFICMSEHEGFCVPLLEAMYFSVPIVAYSAGAVPETLGHGGILVTGKNFDDIAKQIQECFENEMLYHEILDKQRQNIEQYQLDKVTDMLRVTLGKIIERNIND